MVLQLAAQMVESSGFPKVDKSVLHWESKMVEQKVVL